MDSKCYTYKCYKLETFIGFIQKIQNCLSKKLILTLANTKTIVMSG